MKILCVVGARPNFMKVAPVYEALRARGHEVRMVHSGQHYDQKMSEVFFEELGMPRPDVNLEVGSASHAVQTARIMERFEPVVLEHAPDIVLVAGDINSTIACALVAVKLGVRVAHLEAGLRSWDRTMPEEINRVLTDSISDILLTPSADADENLAREGVDPGRVFRVGNAMIDSLLEHRDRALGLNVPASRGLEPGNYAVLTLHRPSNVDDEQVFRGLLGAFEQIGARIPILFPIHPRTRKQARVFGLTDRIESAPGLRLVDPLGYLEFLALQAEAAMVLTDSGGIQEETTALGVPCLTLRPNTERPITVAEGTNTVVGVDPERIVTAAFEILDGGGKTGRIPELWDGRTGERVADVLGSI